jgi:LemA protein
MNKRLLAWGVPVVLLLLLAGWAWTSYNGLIDREEAVSASWADVETQYQRRLDLIPNLVETVKGYAEFEQSTLIGVTEARAAAMGALTAARDGSGLAEVERTNTVVTGAVRGLMGYAESYPELKANQNFIDLQNQLEGTENRIAVSRTRYNEVVQAYNKSIKRFPGNIWAGLLGFEAKAYFESAPEAAEAPQVNF